MKVAVERKDCGTRSSLSLASWHGLRCDSDLLERASAATRGWVSSADFVASNTVCAGWTSLVTLDSSLPVQGPV